MNNNKELDKEIQGRIKKDIGNIKHCSKQNSIPKIITDMKWYYSTNNYNEKNLFYRISELETRRLVDDTILTSGIGGLIGFIIGIATASTSSFISSKNPFAKTILILFAVFFGGFCIINMMNSYPNELSARVKYLDKKEIALIEDIIESGNKDKCRRTRFRRSY